MKRWGWPVVALLLLAAVAWYWEMALDQGPPQFTAPPVERAAAGADAAGQPAPGQR